MTAATGAGFGRSPRGAWANSGGKVAASATPPGTQPAHERGGSAKIVAETTLKSGARLADSAYMSAEAPQWPRTGVHHEDRFV